MIGTFCRLSEDAPVLIPVSARNPRGFATHISQFRMTLPDSPFRITSNAGPYSA